MTDIDFAFKKEEIEALAEIIQKRRDVRGNRFLNTPISEEIISAMLSAANSAPSVGFSQPWEFVIVESIKTREKIYKEFKKQNKKANRIFKDSALYSSLKLEGILESYINIAVFYIKPKKAVLGQTAQKRVGEYSVVCAIQNLWLTARAYGVGVGWVSILKPKKVKKILKVGSDRKLIGYLTVGYVTDFADKPELLTLGWDRKKCIDEVVRR